MIYKFKLWVWQPHIAEVFLSANTDREALEVMQSIKFTSLSWKECPMTPLRTTYEVVKDVQIENNTDSKSK